GVGTAVPDRHKIGEASGAHHGISLPARPSDPPGTRCGVTAGGRTSAAEFHACGYRSSAVFECPGQPTMGVGMGDRRASAAEQLAHRYRSLVEHSPDGICVHERGIVVYANPACLRILGAKNLAEVLGQDITRFVHPE